MKSEGKTKYYEVNFLNLGLFIAVCFLGAIISDAIPVDCQYLFGVIIGAFSLAFFESSFYPLTKEEFETSGEKKTNEN